MLQLQTYIKRRKYPLGKFLKDKCAFCKCLIIVPEKKGKFTQYALLCLTDLIIKIANIQCVSLFKVKQNCGLALFFI